MAYIKAVISGGSLELYNYEKDLPIIRRKPKSSRSVFDMGEDREPFGGKTQKNVSKRQDNTRRAGMAFRRLVLSNLEESQPPLFITTTYAVNQTDIGVAYKDWNSFIGGLRYKFGLSFKYICVPEFQKRGAVHFHALFWGLPSDLASSERSSRFLASYWKRGFLDCVLTDGKERLAGYLAKYMIKGYADDRLCNKKAYRCSKNIKRPIVEKDLIGYMYLENKYGIDVDNLSLQDQTFNTKWLGLGRYRLYKITNKNNHV